VSARVCSSVCALAVRGGVRTSGADMGLQLSGFPPVQRPLHEVRCAWFPQLPWEPIVLA